MTKHQIIKIIISVLIAALTALGAAFGLTSCNVTRTVTTRSEAWQKGDTSVVIQTKTVESYDGSRKLVFGGIAPKSKQLSVSINNLTL